MKRFVETPTNMDRINVTPIIDVALVLVIILLMTAPLMAMPELEVTLPQARTRGAEEYKNLTITMDAEGRIAIDEKTIAPGTLGPELARRLAEPGRDESLVIVRADQSLPHVQVRQVLETAKDVGAKRIAIATNQKTNTP